MEVKYSHGWAVGHEDRNKMLRDAYEHLRTSEKANADYDVTTGDCLIVRIEVMDCTVRREAMVIVRKGQDLPEKLTILNG
jgi:ribosomal protein S3AE